MPVKQGEVFHRWGVGSGDNGALYKAIVPITSKLALFGVQYAHMRAASIREIRAEQAALATAA